MAEGDLRESMARDVAAGAWVAGCSTVEEAWSLGLLISEVIGHPLNLADHLKIFATGPAVAAEAVPRIVINDHHELLAVRVFGLVEAEISQPPLPLTSCRPPCGGSVAMAAAQRGSALIPPQQGTVPVWPPGQARPGRG